MEDAKARLDAFLAEIESTEVRRRACMALYAATGEKRYRDYVLDRMDENSGMSLLFALGETGDASFRQSAEALAARLPMDAEPRSLYLYQPFHAAWDVRFGGRRDAREIARLFSEAGDCLSDKWYRLALVDCVEQMDIQLYEHYRVMADLILKAAQAIRKAPSMSAADCYLLLKGVRLGLLDGERYLPPAVRRFDDLPWSDCYPLAYAEIVRMKA